LDCGDYRIGHLRMLRTPGRLRLADADRPRLPDCRRHHAQMWALRSACLECWRLRIGFPIDLLSVPLLTPIASRNILKWLQVFGCPDATRRGAGVGQAWQTSVGRSEKRMAYWGSP